MNSPDANEARQTGNVRLASRFGKTEAPQFLAVGSWEWNLETKKYSWGQEMYQIFKPAGPPAPPRTGTFFRCIHPDDRKKVMKALGKALVGKQPYNLEHRIVWPDGSVRLIHGQAEVSFDQRGRPLRMVGTVRDITE